MQRGQLDRIGPRCVDAVDMHRCQNAAALQPFDQARNGFKAQIGDVCDVLPGGQNDLGLDCRPADESDR
jgi:hypothetical protein